MKCYFVVEVYDSMYVPVVKEYGRWKYDEDADLYEWFADGAVCEGNMKELYRGDDEVEAEDVLDSIEFEPVKKWYIDYVVGYGENEYSCALVDGAVIWKITIDEDGRETRSLKTITLQPQKEYK